MSRQQHRSAGRPVTVVGALLTSWLAVLAPAAAQVVLESVRAPPGVALPLAAGDVLVRWQAIGAESPRGGALTHWGELELLPYLESSRGPVEVELRRAGTSQRVNLAPAAWTFTARPLEVNGELRELVDRFAADGPEVAAAEVERRLAGASPPVRSWVWTRYAQSRGKSSDWAGASAAFARAITAAPAPFTGELERHRGDALRRSGRLDEAEAAYRRGLAIWRRHAPDGLGVSMLLSALGNFRSAQHDLVEAGRLHEESRQIRQRLAAGSWLYGGALSNLGVIAGRRNDLAGAERFLLEALEINERQHGEIAPMLANLGTVARLRGDFERSEMYTRRALELYRRAGKASEVSDKLQNLGNLLGDTGRLDEALALYDEALALLGDDGADRARIGTLWANRAKIQQLRGDLGAAALDLAKAGKYLQAEPPRTDVEAMLTGLLAEQARARGDLARAAELAQTALAARARLQPDSSFEALAAMGLARIRAAQGRDDEADSLFRRSVEALERQQQRLGGGDRGLVAYRAKYAGIYREYLKFLLRAGRVEAAFELYERSRAQALLALLRERDLDFDAREVDPRLERRRHDVALQLEGAYAALGRLPLDAVDARAERRLEIERLHAEREAASGEIHAASARVAAIEAPPALELSAIRQRLPEGTLLLAYSLGKESSTLFALAAGAPLTAHPIAAGETSIADAVDRWRDLTAATSVRRAQLGALERRLSGWLLAPVAARLAGARRLLIVPDGALHGLAFAALPDPRDPGKRLIEALPVARQVSASVHAELAGRPSPKAVERVVVFADPTHGTAGAARFRGDLDRLPATRREAAGVRAVFGDRTRVYVDSQATEAAARREIGAATLAHFACHAVVDERLPLDSALLLSPAGGDEGLLQAWEIAEQLEVDSELVVLSACETARGADRAGEGILGLVRALQVAGAKSVIASLWRVDDDSTAELMRRFYAHLANGRPRDEALRQAQLELLHGPVVTVRDGRRIELRTADPRHWAPFVLVGPGD